MSSMSYWAFQPMRRSAVHPGKCRHVALGEVDHVDVVTHAGAVGGGVVVAKDLYGLELAHGHLRHVGHEVVGDALGILADESRRVRADGVEVAEQHDVPLGVGRVEVGEDLLYHPLGPAVGVGAGLLGALLGERKLVRVAVDGAGAREDDGLAAVVAHDVHERERALDVVVVVLDGLLDRLAHGLEAGEVDHAVDGVLVEDAVERIAVEHVVLVEGEAARGLVAHDLAHAVERHDARVGQVVDHHDLVA